MTGFVVDITRGCGDLITRVPGIYDSVGLARAAAEKLRRGNSFRIRPATASDVCRCGDRATIANLCPTCWEKKPCR